MTRYAVDAERGVLVGAWATGAGDRGFTVAALPASCPADLALRVAAGLDRLSGVLWRCYTHPASAAGDEGELDSEGWRRAQEREAFATVVPGVTEPNLPQDGMLLRSYSPVTENAHMLGRTLHEIGDAEFTAQIAADVEAEIAAIGKAELGDLSGRARQAVVLTRQDASPVQVAAADRLLHEDPLGSVAMFTDVDPTSAAVAAAHWLHAAAAVVAEVSGGEVTGVIAEADDVEALPVATPTIVLELMAGGASAREAVTRLIGEAMAVAEGRLPNLPGLLAAFAELAERAEHAGPDDAEELEAMLEHVRATPLDPSRPALDLLEDLLSGIYGCALLYREYQAGDEIEDEADEVGGVPGADEVADKELAAVDLEGVEDVVGLMLSQAGVVEAEAGGADGGGADVGGVDVGEGGVDFDGQEDDDEDGEWLEVGSEEFLDAVRAEAAEHAGRLY
ncbi:MAG: hypothetical protein ACJ786_41135 [Catenulispora sp.]